MSFSVPGRFDDLLVPRSGWSGAGPGGEVVEAVVPLGLRLPSGTGCTLRVDPDLDPEAEDGTPQVLGRGRRVFLFRTVAELAAFTRTARDHTLSPRPAWPAVGQRLATDDFVPLPMDRVDLVAIGAALSGEEPSPWVAWDLAAALNLVSDLAEQCHLPDVDESLGPLWDYAADPHRLTALLAGPGNERAALADTWQRAVAAVDTCVDWLDVDVPAEPLPTRPPAAPSAGDLTPIEDVAPLETLWLGLGTAGSGYTLRERVDDPDDPEQRWLTDPEGRLVLRPDLPGLQAYARTASTPLAAVPGWLDVVARDDVDWEPYEDNVIDFTDVSFGADLDEEAAQRTVDAYFALTAVAAAVGADDVLDEVAEGTSVARYVLGPAIDVARRVPGAERALRDVDGGPLRASWHRAVSLLAASVDAGG